VSHGDEPMPRVGATPDALDHGAEPPEPSAEGVVPGAISESEESLDEWIATQSTISGVTETPGEGLGGEARGAAAGPRTGVGGAPTTRLRHLGRAVSERAWLVVAGAAAITLIATMDFRPPSKVRVQTHDGAELVGDAPLEDVDVQASPQSVVVRAELSRYEAAASELGARPRGGDEDDPTTLRVVLARPVVTTLYGLTATFEQTLRLDGGRHEVDVAVEVTPRVGDARRGELPPIRLERDVRIVSRRHASWAWWDRSPVERLVMHEHTTLADATQGTSQLTFAIDDQLFVLSLDVTRPSV
jgi:hypothetical protein